MMADALMKTVRRLGWSAYTLWHVRREHRLPYWSTGRLVADQNRQVQGRVRYVYRTFPHYRAVMNKMGIVPTDIGTAGDQKWLPLIKGPELRLNPHMFMSRRFRPERGARLYTIGTSGHSNLAKQSWPFPMYGEPNE